MALIADIRVNHTMIGRLVCVRKEQTDPATRTHRYECSAVLAPHPSTTESIETPIIDVEHPYDENAFALIRRAIETMDLS